MARDPDSRRPWRGSDRGFCGAVYASAGGEAVLACLVFRHAPYPPPRCCPYRQRFRLQASFNLTGRSEEDQRFKGVRNWPVSRQSAFGRNALLRLLLGLLVRPNEQQQTDNDEKGETGKQP